MQKRENIMRASSGIILVVLLVSLQLTAIFAASKCGDACYMHNQPQKEVKTCCHSDVAAISMSSIQVCTVPANTVVVFNVVKTQLTRSSTSKVLSSDTMHLLVESEQPDQYDSFFSCSSAHLNYKETAIYLLDSISLT